MTLCLHTHATPGIARSHDARPGLPGAEAPFFPAGATLQDSICGVSVAERPSMRSRSEPPLQSNGRPLQFDFGRLVSRLDRVRKAQRCGKPPFASLITTIFGSKADRQWTRAKAGGRMRSLATDISCSTGGRFPGLRHAGGFAGRRAARRRSTHGGACRAVVKTKEGVTTFIFNGNK